MTRPRQYLLTRMFLSAAIIVGAAAVAPPAALAEPNPESSGTSVDPTLALRSLGFGPAQAFYGLQDEVALTIPVPRGLQPVELVATVELPANLLRGTLAIIQDDRTITRVPLPAEDLTTVRIPLAGVEVMNNSARIQLRSYLVPPPDYCLYDPSNPLRLTDAAIRYTGAEVIPSTVAAFLPPVLRQLTIHLPPDPSHTESQAALLLATAAISRYPGQDVDVRIVPLDRGAAPAPAGEPFHRQILIREGEPVGIALLPGEGVPALSISGSEGDLMNQARLLWSNLSRLAVSGSAVVSPLQAAPQFAADLREIRELGQPGVNATAIANPRVVVPIDQTRLARPAKDVRVHLRGTYTPLPVTMGGHVVVSVAGQTVASWPTDSGGSIDRWVDIPNRLLSRYTDLTVEIQATGNSGRCGEYQPITLTIDGGSEVQSSAAAPPVPAGFQSLPQALMPRMQVGIRSGADALPDTIRAASILTGLQRLSGLPLDSVVVSLDEAIDSSEPAVLISPDSWDDARVALPVAASADGPITVEGTDGAGNPATLTLTPEVRFGSLQTTFDGQRTIVAATSNGDAAQLDSLLEWLGADPRRWSTLSGSAIVAPRGEEPILVSAPEENAPSSVDSPESSPTWWVVAGLIAVLIPVAVVLALWARRRTAGD